MVDPAHNKVEKQGRNYKQSSMTAMLKYLNKQRKEQKKANCKNQHAHQEAVTTTPVQIKTKAIHRENKV